MSAPARSPAPPPVAAGRPEDGPAAARRDGPFAGVGTEPDPRFTYANERTFLAWIRTALALVAAGLAAAQFLSLDPRALRLAVALPLIALGAGAAARSYRRWQHSERALRLGRPLPYSSFLPALAYGVAATSLVCGLLAVFAHVIR